MAINEKRLIDANRLKMRMIAFATAIKREYLSIEAIVDTINTEDTVDAEEVVHGRWLDVQETDMYVPDMKFTITKTAETCSNCKVRIGFIGAKQYLFDAVCPNCGAKMDGNGNG